ncbi:hypothetical protein FHL15_009423 [Xylaria flabelliformis]|uniref:Uncharacterized protein n=1 Tax=Xylaria flabelliformis TaxID=2512241 RepID=A0A553HNY4_9PEZI|nr:hypothetical protein FHL15_009423 [Xylaria flabelliformis]
MPLFRWRFGPRSLGTPEIAGCASQDGTDDNNNPPPSYQESQNASLHAVLQGAVAVAPILWPSACSSLNTIKEPSSFQSGCPDAGEKEKEKQNGQLAIFGPSAEENGIIEVFTYLAMTPCGDHPFLDRIRDFSDFYFTPYIASDGAAIQSSSPQGGNNGGGSSHRETQETVPVQERLRKALQHLEVLRESSALVLCARVLEEYYAGLKHIDSIVDMDIAQDESIPDQQFPNEKAMSSSSAEAAKRSAPIRTKTRLTQIAACLEEDCNCCDFDETQSKTDRTDYSSPSTTLLSCNCGHPRTSHTPSPLGISRLLRRHTNWDSVSYNALRHRSSVGLRKTRIHEIKVCAASGRCPCWDYDKGPRTGRCARCGHYDKDHVPLKPAQAPDKKHGKKKEKGKEKDGQSTTGGDDLENGEWELSWILVENAYLLLNRITPSYESNC